MPRATEKLDVRRSHDVDDRVTWRWCGLLGFLLMTGVDVAVLTVPITAQPTPDVSGVWVLNYELSDEPRAQVPAELGERGRGRSQPRGGLGGFGGGGFGAAGPRGGWQDYDRRTGGLSVEDVDRLRRAVSDQLTAPRRMTVTQDHREILFAYDDGRYVRIVPDGREHAGIAGQSQVVRKSRWDGDTLVAEVKFSTNHKVHHRLALRHAGEQLVVTTILEPRGSQDEVRVRRIYDLTER